MLSNNEESNTRRLFGEKRKYATVSSLTKVAMSNAYIGKHPSEKSSVLENLENHKKSVKHVDQSNGLPGRCPLSPCENVFLHNGISGHYFLLPYEFSAIVLLAIAHSHDKGHTHVIIQ